MDEAAATARRWATLLVEAAGGRPRRVGVFAHRSEASYLLTLGEKVLPGIRATLAEDGPARGSAIWFASLDAAGVLDDVSGLDETRALPGVTEVACLARPGAEVGRLVTSKSRVALARALGESADEAVAAARAAVERLEFRLRVPGRRGATVGRCPSVPWRRWRWVYVVIAATASGPG
ncbi:hypothetical protein ACWKT3_24200 [Streptomyces violaceus]